MLAGLKLRERRRIDNELFAPLIIMAMQVESLEVLEKADVAPAQARAIIRAIEIELVGARETLATKQDLLLLRQDMHQDMEKLRRDVHESMEKLRGGVHENMQKLRGDVHENMETLRREMLDEMLDVRGDVASLRGVTSRRRFTQVRRASRDRCTWPCSAKWPCCSAFHISSRPTFAERLSR